MKPFFSIVMANYNSGLYIEQAILSVLHQSCSDYELIICDGGSTDNSVDVIKKYDNKISWWVSEPDHGQSDAFNKGFSHASGEYYVWLNADDLMLPGTLEKVKEYIHKHPYEKWIATDVLYINKNNSIVDCYYGTDFSNKILNNGLISDIGPSTFYHYKLWKEYGPFDKDFHYLMDLYLWRKFVQGGYAYKRVHIYGWAFRLHEGSKTSGSITGTRSPQQAAEGKLLRDRTDYHFNKFTFNLQRAKKLFYSYPKSFMDRIRMKGKKIEF